MNHPFSWDFPLQTIQLLGYHGGGPRSACLRMQRTYPEVFGAEFAAYQWTKMIDPDPRDDMSANMIRPIRPCTFFGYLIDLF